MSRSCGTCQSRAGPPHRSARAPAALRRGFGSAPSWLPVNPAGSGRTKDPWKCKQHSPSPASPRSASPARNSAGRAGRPSRLRPGAAVDRVSSTGCATRSIRKVNPRSETDSRGITAAVRNLAIEVACMEQPCAQMMTIVAEATVARREADDSRWITSAMCMI